MSSSVTGVRYTTHAGSIRLADITQCNQSGLQLGISVPEVTWQFRYQSGQLTLHMERNRAGWGQQAGVSEVLIQHKSYFLTMC